VNRPYGTGDEGRKMLDVAPARTKGGAPGSSRPTVRRETELSTSSVGLRRQLPLKIARAWAEARLPRRSREAISRRKQRVSPLMTLSCFGRGDAGRFVNRPYGTGDEGRKMLDVAPARTKGGAPGSSRPTVRRETELSTSSVGLRRQLPLKIARAPAEARLPRRSREAISRGKRRVSPLMTLSCFGRGTQGDSRESPLRYGGRRGFPPHHPLRGSFPSRGSQRGWEDVKKDRSA
jgi:hypothetical protein